jgi:hypothetical protein
MALHSSARSGLGTVKPPAAPLVVTHPALAAPALVPGGAGAGGAGDQRFWSFTGRTLTGSSVLIDWVMATTQGSDAAGGEERRISDAVFSFASNNGDQIVLNGVASYPTGTSTLQLQTTATRAITGGTGRYQQAAGQVFSQHFGDGSWSHTFLFGRSDVIVGTTADDHLRPSAAELSCMAGLEGADRFLFNQRPRPEHHSPDLITDFAPQERDVIVFKRQAYPGLKRIKVSSVSSIASLGAEGGGQASVVFDQSSGTIWLDLNGPAAGWGVFGGPVVAVPPTAAITRTAFALV